MAKARNVLASVVVTIGALGISACSSQPAEQTVVISADYPSYDNVQSLATDADLIVEVTLGAPMDDVLLPQYEGDDPTLNPYAGTSETPPPGEGAVPITVYDATVETSYRGDASAGDVIKVMQLGGVLDGVEYVADGVESLAEGATILLFLKTYPDSPADVVGGDIGAFVANGDTYISLGGSKLVVTSSELNAL